MDRIVKPRIRAQGGTAAGAWSEESAHSRLLKYIPLEISGAFALLDNVVAGYVMDNKEKVLGIPPMVIGWFIFTALLLIFLYKLHRQFDKLGKNSKRWSMERMQVIISTIAFAIWTYSINSMIWAPLYEPGMALIVVVLFLLAAGNIAPTMSPDEARTTGFLPDTRKETEKGRGE